ncbi:MAG: hypothetical protein NTW18_04795 [Candidatus Omnitrophica bacterium]|nr:hypothetical protein [Candidatus Omnitrophota bacterium]
MTAVQAKAEVFLTAFGALPRAEQNAVLFGLIHNARLREDIIDLTIAETRNCQSSRPLKIFLTGLRKEKNS